MATLLSILLEPVFSLVDLLWRGRIFHNFLFHRSVLEIFSVWYDNLPSQHWGWVDKGNITPTGHVVKIIAQTCMQYLNLVKRHLCLPPWFTNVWYEWCKSRTVPWFHFPGSLSPPRGPPRPPPVLVPILYHAIWSWGLLVLQTKSLPQLLQHY